MQKIRVALWGFGAMGSGIAGLMSAIHLAPYGRVLLITKKNSAESSSNYAQGGIACVMEPGDSFEKHVADTLDAGAGLCNEAVVRHIVGDAPAASKIFAQSFTVTALVIQWMIGRSSCILL